MAGISTEQESGSLNVDLNLVPFIDLLSTLTLFLLVTAVWLQISAIPASVEGKGEAAASAELPPPSDRLTIRVTNSGYRLTWPEAITKKIALPGGISRSRTGYDANRLQEAISHTLKNYKIGTAAVSADDDVDYGALVQAIDTAKNGGILSVALSTE